jgi:hypothetical protein
MTFVGSGMDTNLDPGYTSRIHNTGQNIENDDTYEAKEKDKNNVKCHYTHDPEHV